MILLLILFIITYFISIIGCATIILDKDLEIDCLSLFLMFCPIINTILGLKYSDWKIFDKLKHGNK